MGIPITSFLKKKIMAYWNKCAICTFTSCPVSQREFLSKSWPFLPYYLMSSPLFCSSSEQHAPRCAIFKKRGSFYCRPSAASCDNVKKVHPKWRRWACISFERDLFIRKGDFMQWPCFVTIWVVNAHYTFCLEQYFYVRKTYPHALLMWCYTFCKREAQQQLFSVVQIGKMQHKKLERCRRPLFLLRTFDHFLLSLLPCHKIGLFSMSWQLSLY